MKKTTALIALTSVAMLNVLPVTASADDDRWENERHEYRRNEGSMGGRFEQYSAEEMRIMAHGRALQRFGPGVQVAMNETVDGTYRVELRDSEKNLIREHEFNRFGDPVRDPRKD